MPARVLAVLPRHLGDAVHCLPALDALRRAGFEVHAVAEPPARVLCAALSGDGAVGPAAVGAPAGGGRPRFDAAALFARSLRAALRVRRVPLRIGHAGDGRRLLLTHVVPPGPLSGSGLPRLLPAGNAIDEALHVAAVAAAALDVALPAVGRTPTLPRPPRARGRAILLHPGSQGLPSKRWPERRWRALAEALPDAVLTGAVSERDALTRMAAGRPVAAEDLGAWMERAAGAACVVAADTGVAWLGAALGAPVVALFGPTDPRRHATPGAVVLGTRRPCAPCYRGRCRWAAEPACMVDHDVPAVLRAIDTACGGRAGAVA